MNRVALLTPNAYMDAHDYLRSFLRVIASALNQTYPNKKAIIIVDDGSQIVVWILSRALAIASLGNLSK